MTGDLAWVGYEQAVLSLAASAHRSGIVRCDDYLVVGCPRWVTERLAREIGTRLDHSRSGLKIVRIADLSVVGAEGFEGDDELGTLVAYQLLSGTFDLFPVKCHPEVPPHRWADLTAALAAGLRLPAAVMVSTLDA